MGRPKQKACPLTHASSGTNVVTVASYCTRSMVTAASSARTPWSRALPCRRRVSPAVDVWIEDVLGGASALSGATHAFPLGPDALASSARGLPAAAQPLPWTANALPSVARELPWTAGALPLVTRELAQAPGGLAQAADAMPAATIQTGKITMQIQPRGITGFWFSPAVTPPRA